MWMEEKIGKRINVERTDEALATDADLISTACPFCIVMLSDAVTAKQQDGSAKEGVQVLDVSQILARSLAPKKVPAMAGAGHVEITQDVTEEAPKPVGETPDATAGADQAQLAQTAGITGVGTVSDGASSGETLRPVPTEGEQPERVEPASAGSGSTSDTQPIGPSESQSSSHPEPPSPSPEKSDG
jgi:hypothetical protein